MRRARHDLDGVDATEIAFYVQNINNICAVCLQLHENCRTSNMQEELPVHDKIEIYKLLESISLLKYSEKIPQLLCSTCSFKLVNIYEFQQMCNRSHFYFNEYIKQEDAQDTSELEIGDEELHGICSDSEELTVAKAFEGTDNENQKISGMQDACHRTSETTTEVLPVNNIVSDTIKLVEIENRIIVCTEIQESIELTAPQSSHCDTHSKVSPELETGRTDTIEGDGVTNESNSELDSSNTLASSVEMKTQSIIDHQASASVELTEHYAHPKEHSDLDKGFNHQDSLLMHMQSHINDNDKPNTSDEKMYQCRQCLKSFTNARVLQCHGRVHSDERSHSCSSCDKKFKTQSNLNRHMLIHSGIRPFTHKKSQRTTKVSSQSEIGRTDTTGRDGVTNESNSELDSSNTITDSAEMKTAPAIDHQVSTPDKVTDHDAHPKEHFDSDKKERRERKLKCNYHQEVAHGTKRPLLCKLCAKPFKSQAGLKLHMASHVNVRSHVCSICSKSFNRRGNLWLHSQSHINDNDKSKINVEKTYKCKQCAKLFISAGLLRAHSRVHSDERPYPCSSCDVKFKTQANLNRHMITHSEIRPFVCSYCNRDFRTKGYLQKHLLGMHQKSGVISDRIVIDHQASTSVELTEHDAHPKEHLDLDKKESCIDNRKATSREHVCKYCNKAFSGKNALIGHERSHTGERPFKCKQCAKTFAMRHTLQHHQLTHQIERPWLCELCAMSFKDQASLKVHMAIHVNARSHVCSICNKGFNRRGDLWMHSQSHINDNDKPETGGKKTYQCTQCAKLFISAGVLRAHASRVHSEERSYACTLCDKAFKTKANLDRHMFIHSGIRPFACPYCSKDFNAKHHIKIHLRTHQK